MDDKNYFAFARHALVAGLRHVRVHVGEEIGIPEFICRDVLSSLSAVGAVPRFYPVDKNLQPIDCGQSQSARVVLMVNYFGFPQDISMFSRLWPKAVLVEDNAHGFLSRDENGRLLGTRTDVGITSVRKTIRVPDGAFLSTKAPLDPFLLIPPENRVPNLGFRSRAYLSKVEKRTNMPLHQISRSAVRAVRWMRTGMTLPPSDARSERELPTPRAISTWSLNALEKLNADYEIERRRALFREFAECAKRSNVELTYPTLPTGCAPYGFPFFSVSPPRDINRLARHHHCEIINWPDLPEAVIVPDDHFYRQLRVVNFI